MANTNLIEVRYDRAKKVGYYKLHVRLFEYIRLERGHSLKQFYVESGITEKEYESIRFEGETGRFEDVTLREKLLDYIVN